MKDMAFTSDQKAQMTLALQRYFEAELEQELGRFEAEFLLDFIAEQLGPHFYNKGVADAHAVMAQQMEGITDALYALERPLPRR